MHAIFQAVNKFWQFSISNRFTRYELAFIALIVRLLFLPQASLDLFVYISWYDAAIRLGAKEALATGFSGYAPIYQYLMIFLAQFSFLPSFISIKLVSIAVDFLGAFLVLRLIKMVYPTGKLHYAAFFAVLYAPTVIINGAYWGQSDIIYTTCLLGALYFILKDKPFYAMLCFSIGFSFKIQSVIFSPFILMLLLKRKIPWRYLLLPPVVYLLLAMPTWLAGRPIRDTLFIYAQQADTFHALSMNAPNLYQFLPNSQYDLFFLLGAAVAAILALVYAVVSARSRTELSPNRLVLEATAVLMWMPFFLPKMHERYFYPAALFAIVLAFYQPRYRLVALTLQATSMLSYLPFLKGYPPQVIQAASVLNTLLVAWLIWKWIKILFPRQASINPALST